MEWHINDLSLSGQYADEQAFRAALEPLLQLRRREPLLQSSLYCSRMLRGCKVTVMYDFKDAVRATGDKNYINLVLGWIDKSGPFWDDTRQFNEDDYFEYQGTNVTDQGMGEAARRILVGNAANSFSFPLTGFVSSPLTVQHGLSEAPIGFVEIENHWQITQIESALESCRKFNSWLEMQEEIKRRFGQLIFSADAVDKLLPLPFSKPVMERIFHLLSLLNQLVLASDASGKLSREGEEVLKNYFAGATAGKTPLFKPESTDNQHNFKNDLTFRDPRDDSKDLFCHWHGKIQTPQTRIHFEWPRPRGQREIKVVYIGPKITKD